MKQTLQLKLSQHLTLTPQLQQSIRLLQLSTMELNQELEKFLAENPLLERDDADAPVAAVPAHVNGEAAPATQSAAESADPESPAQADTYSAELDWGGEGGGSGGGKEDSDESDYSQVAADSPNLREHLHRQLTLTKLEPRDRALVAFLIEALDEDGYLTQPLQELEQIVPEELQLEPEELQIALKQLQNLDPTGVGARNCAECLELQLLAMPESTPARAVALALVRSHLELLAARDFAKLRKALQCGDEDLRQAQKLIQSLNPRPGAAFTPLETSS
jgi:RNA polymerase sigma-54 factor